MIAHREQDGTKKDAFLDQAIANIGNAKKIAQRNQRSSRWKDLCMSFVLQ